MIGIDDYLVVLSPTDYVKFQITLEGEGSGGTILGIPAPERRFEFAYSSSFVRKQCCL